ncbi:MAG TPA: DoxX-like family protein [Lacipirellulaceae bacterium]
MSIYVETFIRGSIEDVWQKTQTPELHEKWDLRFTSIEYLHRLDESQPQRFLYSTRIGFGLNIAGEGESVGTKNATDGSRTSALKFWSNDPKSLIEEGAGYWQYRIAHDGVCFLTSYDYRVRLGRIGRTIDTLVFRPLLGWATAWSFDRLRLWIEKDAGPASSLRFAVVHIIATLVIALVWIYQGAIPKLLFAHESELAMLTDAGIPSSAVRKLLLVIGWTEIAIGLLTVAFSKARWPFLLTIALMVVATTCVVTNSREQLWQAFNPVSLNVLMAGMAAVALACISGAPSASRCLRTPRENRP